MRLTFSSLPQQKKKPFSILTFFFSTSIVAIAFIYIVDVPVTVNIDSVFVFWHFPFARILFANWRINVTSIPFRFRIVLNVFCGEKLMMSLPVCRLTHSIIVLSFISVTFSLFKSEKKNTRIYITRVSYQLFGIESLMLFMWQCVCAREAVRRDDFNSKYIIVIQILIDQKCLTSAGAKCYFTVFYEFFVFFRSFNSHPMCNKSA